MAKAPYTPLPLSIPKKVANSLLGEVRIGDCFAKPNSNRVSALLKTTGSTLSAMGITQDCQSCRVSLAVPDWSAVCETCFADEMESENDKWLERGTPWPQAARSKYAAKVQDQCAMWQGHDC